MERLEPKDVDALAKVRAKRMKQSDVREAFKGHVLDLPADGKREPYVVDVKNDRRGIEKLRELRRPYARAATAWASEMAAKESRTKVRSPRGGVIEVASHSEQTAKTQGFLPVKIWSPVRKFAACPRQYFPCGHYTETAGETVCYWCAEEQ